MKKLENKRDMSLLILLVLLAALVGSLVDYGLQNERRVKENVYETLGEASRQQIVLLDTKLDDLFSQLKLLSDYISERDVQLDEDVLHLIDRSAEEYGMYGLGLVDAGTGVAQLNSGQRFDVSERAYFQRAREGESNIEHIPSGLLTGAEIVVLAVPVYRDGAVAAVLFACYDTEGFARLLEAWVFSGRSYSYVADAEGDVIVGPNHESAILPSGNVLELFAAVQLERGVSAEDVAAHLQNGDAFTFSFAAGGEERYASFTPAGFNGWTMVYVATGDVVTERTTASAFMVYSLALKLLVVFALFTVALWLRERRSQSAIALREEEYRVAAGHSDRVILRYDLRNKTIFYAAGHEPANASKRTLTEGVPESTVAAGLVAEESVQDYLDFYGAMLRGEPTGAKVFRMRSNSDDFAWFRADYTLIGGKTPRYAIVSYYDVTRQREQELVYENWRQSLRERDAATYAFYHCSISEDSILEAEEGMLLPYTPGACITRLSERTEEYAQRLVREEDREGFRSLMDRKSQLARFAQGRKTDALEYREITADGGFRWLRLTVDLVGFSYSDDVEGFLLFENIDAAKRAELEILERAETDPLTGILNRVTFARRVDEMIGASAPEARHALLMMDVDCFKLVNDVFGHGAGDQTLVDIAEKLRGSLRRGDLLGRLGGDEFVVFLADIPGEETAAKKAKQICELAQKTFSAEVQISASVGIALFPQDGDDFETLYKKADDTLYYVKGSGKNNFAFYRDELLAERGETPPPRAENPAAARLGRKKRRMLIVDDSRIDFELLENIFSAEYRIERAASGSAALARLNHYGSAVSVMLLDLMMPGMDGFAVLEKMRQSAELQSVPVVVVSARGERETSLRAIRAGASDYVTKPVDPELLRIRVQSAVSKAENERLRAHNSFLELQSGELSSYKTVLEKTGIFMVENDWGAGVFTYGATVGEHLAGKYDQRPFWHILLSDQVADAQTVRQMQQFAHDLANDRSRAEGGMTVSLAAAGGGKRDFEMTVYKTTDEYGLTDKLLLTFRELEAGTPAGE